MNEPTRVSKLCQKCHEIHQLARQQLAEAVQKLSEWVFVADDHGGHMLSSTGDKWYPESMYAEKLAAADKAKQEAERQRSEYQDAMVAARQKASDWQIHHNHLCMAQHEFYDKLAEQLEIDVNEDSWWDTDPSEKERMLLEKLRELKAHSSSLADRITDVAEYAMNLKGVTEQEAENICDIADGTKAECGRCGDVVDVGDIQECCGFHGQGCSRCRERAEDCGEVVFPPTDQGESKEGPR